MLHVMPIYETKFKVGDIVCFNSQPDIPLTVRWIYREKVDVVYVNPTTGEEIIYPRRQTSELSLYNSTKKEE